MFLYIDVNIICILYYNIRDDEERAQRDGEI